jgi:hypothetical protein
MKFVVYYIDVLGLMGLLSCQQWTGYSCPLNIVPSHSLIYTRFWYVVGKLFFLFFGLNNCIIDGKTCCFLFEKFLDDSANVQLASHTSSSKSY